MIKSLVLLGLCLACASAYIFRVGGETGRNTVNRRDYNRLRHGNNPATGMLGAYHRDESGFYHSDPTMTIRQPYRPSSSDSGTDDPIPPHLTHPTLHGRRNQHLWKGYWDNRPKFIRNRYFARPEHHPNEETRMILPRGPGDVEHARAVMRGERRDVPRRRGSWNPYPYRSNGTPLERRTGNWNTQDRNAGQGSWGGQGWNPVQGGTWGQQTWNQGGLAFGADTAWEQQQRVGMKRPK